MVRWWDDGGVVHNVPELSSRPCVRVPYFEAAGGGLVVVGMKAGERVIKLEPQPKPQPKPYSSLTLNLHLDLPGGLCHHELGSSDVLIGHAMRLVKVAPQRSDRPPQPPRVGLGPVGPPKRKPIIVPRD